jgi:hypothetical protein
MWCGSPSWQGVLVLTVRAEEGSIGKKKCVPHGGLRWGHVGRVDAAWVPHSDRSQRVKRVNALTQRDVRGKRAERWAWRANEKAYISRARTMMHSERHARSDRRHSEDGNGAYEVCI